jgi:hypothetical protein
MSQCRFWIQPNGCQSHCINLWQIRMVMVHFGLRASGESDVERYPKANWTFWAASCLAGPLSSNRHLSVVCSTTGSWATTAWYYRTLWNRVW